MTRTTEMNNMIEERNNLCKYLYLIKKDGLKSLPDDVFLALCVPIPPYV